MNYEQEQYLTKRYYEYSCKVCKKKSRSKKRRRAEEGKCGRCTKEESFNKDQLKLFDLDNQPSFLV